MRGMPRRIGVPALALASMLAEGTWAIGYPALDTTSHWTLQDWGFAAGSGFYLQGANKTVWTAPGQREDRSVFYQAAVLGVRLEGRGYPLANPDYMGEMEGAGYLVRYASFTPTAGLVVTVVYYLHDNGEFETFAYFQGPAYTPGMPWELVMRLDYDLAEAGNNTVEFLWNRAGEGGGVSPPQFPGGEVLDGRLVYAAEAGSPSHWAASSHEISVGYPPLRVSESDGAERPAFARILHSAHPRFGMLLWGDGHAALEATFKAYGYFDGNLAPGADPGALLQLTGEGAGRPRYAYAGRDQMVFLRFTVPLQGVVRFRSKVFQRPASRPLSVRVFQHPPGDMGGWTFDPDRVIRVTADGPRTFRQALEDLAGADDVAISTAATGLPWLPFDGYAPPGHSVSESLLHSMMTAMGTAAPVPAASAREWHVNLFLVNWSLAGEPQVWESMFDQGGADLNRISREGAAVFWPSLGGSGEDRRQRQAVLSALHGLGLALNMQPAWSNCPFAGYCWQDGAACGGMRCGQACPPGVSGCRYRAHSCEHECTDGTIMSLTDVDRNTLRFHSGPASGSAHSEIDWYRHGPEAWVKPGRFGIAPVSGPQLPPFLRN